MSEATQKKIDSLAASNQNYCFCRGPVCDCNTANGGAKMLIKEGAAPWADWCERLALTLSYITDEANGKTECHNMAKVAISDYEKWLEQTDE